MFFQLTACAAVRNQHMQLPFDGNLSQQRAATLAQHGSHHVRGL